LDATRHWKKEDQDFAHSIADLCALIISADKQRDTATQFRESRRCMFLACVWISVEANLTGPVKLWLN
jgi:hypothetical protein